MTCNTASTELNAVEIAKRSQLQREKPLVHAKIVQYAEKAKRGESIAILQFQYDYTCNFKCEHCSADNFMLKTAKEKKADTRRYLMLADVRDLFCQADDMGLANTTITGGEPLTYPDLDQVVEAIDPSRFYIAMDTNGWHLDLKRAKHLKAIGIDKVQPSLDSIVQGEHDAFRRKKGAYARVMRAIDAGLEAGLNVMLQTVIWKDRLYSQEFLDYLEFAKSKGIGTYVSLAKPVGCWENKHDHLCGDDDIRYLEELEKRYNVFTHLTPGYGIDVGCIAVKRMVSITKYGDVMPCPYTFTSLGNVFEQPLRDIIESGLKVRYFSFNHKETCLVGNKDDPFIGKYMTKMAGKRAHPVPYREVFAQEDIGQ